LELTVDKFPEGSIKLPPSKSIAHRAIICAGLSQGVSRIENYKTSQDMQATVSCMRALGADIREREDSLTITGGICRPGDILDCHESGSTLRFMIPIVAAMGGGRLRGKGRLMERPLAPYVSALGAKGVRLSMEGDVLTVSGGLTNGSFELEGNVSSQFVSGLLFALPLLRGDSEILIKSRLESASYTELTLRAMRAFGISAYHENYECFRVPGGQSYRSADFSVEGDYSQGAFFLVSAALGAGCTCAGLLKDSAQGDRAILDIISRSGAEIGYTASGDIFVNPPETLRPQVIDASNIPDLVPPAAVLLSMSQGESRIINAARLRLKESDRLETVCAGLNALGGDIRIDGDSLVITGKGRLRGGRVHAANDHRIAMMAAVAAIGCDNPVTVEDWGCVKKSYPGFWEDFMISGKTEDIRRIGL